MGRRARATFMLDVFNAGNLRNAAWGSQYLLPVGISSQNSRVKRIALLPVTGFDPVTRRYHYAVNRAAGVLATTDAWQLQLGVHVNRERSARAARLSGSIRSFAHTLTKVRAKFPSPASKSGL